MGASSFNEMELDAIGEIMNISLGASATAVSTMLGTFGEYHHAGGVRPDKRRI